MARRIFDLFSKAGVEQSITSFSTHGRLLIDTKVKAAKMKVTMGSLMTAALIKGLPMIKTREELIHTICKEFGLNEEAVKKLADEQEDEKGEMDSNTSDTIKKIDEKKEVKQ